MRTQPLPGVILELTFSEGSGTVAHDISGNGNDATFGQTGSAPVWVPAGLSFAEAPGTKNSYLDTSISNWTSAFAYLCPYSGAYPNTVLDPGANWMSGGVLWGPSTRTDGLSFSDSPYPNQVYSIEPTLYYIPANINAGPTFSSKMTGGCHLFAATLGSAADGTLDHLYVDGVEVPYAAQGSSSNLAPTSGHYQIGRVADDTFGYGEFHLEGTLSYMVVSNQQYSQSQVVAETNYILNQIAPRQLGQFPYAANAANNVIFMGDSLTAGYDGVGPAGWYALLKTNNPYTLTSLGLGSLWAADLAAMWPNRENAYFTPGGGHQYCHIWAGTNDMALGNQTPAATWAALQLIAQECIQSGGMPIIATMISRACCDSLKNQLNPLIRAGWQQAGFVAIDDLAAIPEIGADGAYANPTYFVDDGMHLTGPSGVCDTTTGYGIVCNAASNVINQLDAAEEQKKPVLRRPAPVVAPVR